MVARERGLEDADLVRGSEVGMLATPFFLKKENNLFILSSRRFDSLAEIEALT
jgi:hypothetical protein